MQKLLFLVIIASEVLLFPRLGFAQCNLQENSPQLHGIRVGRFDLRFDAGMFSTRNPKGTAHGQSFDFAIGNGGQDVRIGIGAETDRPSMYYIKGTLHLAQPIRGSIAQEIIQGECQQTIALDDNTLNGSSITATKANLPPWFGGEIGINGARLVILDHKSIVSGTRQSHGSLIFTASTLQLKDASLLFPFGSAIDRRFDLKAHDASSKLQLDFSTFTTQIARADLRANAVSFQSVQTDAAHLHVDLTAVKGQELQVEVRNPAAVNVGLMQVTATERSMSHDAPLWADTTKEAPLSFASLVLRAKRADAKGIALDTRGAVYSGIKTTAPMEIGLGPSQKLVSGTANLTVKSLTDDAVDAEVAFQAPKIELFSGSQIAATAGAMTIAATGPKATAKLTVDGEISMLSLAGLAASADMALKMSGQIGVAPSFELKAQKGTVTLGMSAANQLSGQTAGFTLGGTAPSLDPVGGFRFDIPKDGVKIDINLAKNMLPVLGGKLEVPSKKIHLTNGTELVLTAHLAPQSISITTPALSLSGVTYRPNHSANTYAAQSTPASISNPKFSLIIGAPLGTSSFALDCQITLPGISLKPPPPLTAIVVDISGYEVEVTELDVGGFEIDFQGSDVEVTLHDLKLSAGQFRTQTNPDGSPASDPVISGSFSAPLTIESASVTYQLWPNPFAFEDMEIDNLHVALGLSSVVTPNVFEAKDATVDLSIVKATATELQGRLVLTNARVAWRDEVSGFATAEHAELDVTGPRKALNGTLTVGVGNLNAAGTVDVDLGSDNSAATVNCVVTLPAKVAFAIHGIHGQANIQDGKVVNGGIVADHVDRALFGFAGDNECSFGLPLSLTVTINYPCIPDFWNNCSTTLHADMRVPAALVARVLNAYFEARDLRFDVDASNPSHPKFKWCKAYLDKLVSIPVNDVVVRPNLDVVPWPFNKVANEAAEIAVTPFEAALENSIVDIVSGLSILGVGELIPVKDSCSF